LRPAMRLNERVGLKPTVDDPLFKILGHIG
jgi:hypothetical protein